MIKAFQTWPLSEDSASEKIAINVALLPSDKIMRTAILLNKTHLMKKEMKIVLNRRNSLPHVTLVMGCAKIKELPAIKKILRSVALEFFPLSRTRRLGGLRIQIEGTYSHKIPNGEWVSWLKLKRTKILQTLHENLMKNLKPYLSYNAEKSMFVSPRQIDSVTPKLVNQFLKTSAFENYAPHITLGIGKIRKSVPAASFYANCIALCKLGNYCTVRKVLSKYTLSLLLLFLPFSLLFFPFTVQALPIYRSMVKAKKGMAVNCTLCHLPDSWELNKYGKDFLDEGRSFKAIETLDQLDSDGDGFLSLDEWKAGSNPGDSASTPKRAGNWLKEIKPTLPPKKILAPFFDREVTYRVQEEILPEKLISEIEKLTGKKLTDEEKYPTLFWIDKEKLPIGLASYTIAPAKDKEINIYLAVTNGKKILKLHPQHVHSKPLKSKSFLIQFENKSHGELKEIRVDQNLKEESNEILSAVKRTLLIIERLFP